MDGKLQKSLYVATAVTVTFVIWFAAHSARKVEIKRYPMTGRVLEVHLDTQMVRVYNDNIPGFMEPMAMDYKLKDQAALATLKKGDRLSAALVTDQKDVWRLEDVVTQSAPPE